MSQTAHVLLLDDDQAFTHTHKTLLEKIGNFEVTMVESQQALSQALQNKDKPVDLLMMGLRPYGLNGIEFCQKIKNKKDFEHLPILMLTQSDDVKDVVEAYRSGIHDFIRKPINLDELLARMNAALFLRGKWLKQKEREAELVHLTHELMLEKYDLEQMAFTDSLTELGNRRAFEESFINVWLNSYVKNYMIGLLLIEVLEFKEYNDTYGQHFGDEALIKVAKVLTRKTRPAHSLSRIGGKEFAVLFSQADSQDILALARNVRDEVKELKINHSNASYGSHLAVNLGGALILPQKTDKDTKKTIMSKANQALDLARNMGAGEIKLIESQSNEMVIY